MQQISSEGPGVWPGKSEVPPSWWHTSTPIPLSAASKRLAPAKATAMPCQTSTQIRTHAVIRRHTRFDLSDKTGMDDPG
jgi:hypothetical protein